MNSFSALLGRHITRLLGLVFLLVMALVLGGFHQLMEVRAVSMVVLFISVSLVVNDCGPRTKPLRFAVNYALMALGSFFLALVLVFTNNMVLLISGVLVLMCGIFLEFQRSATLKGELPKPLDQEVEK